MPTRLPTCLASLALALTAMAATAAEWTQLPYPASSGMAVYAEPSTAQPRHGAFVGFFVRNPMQAWFVTDYAIPHRWRVHQMSSTKQWLEFDCKNTAMRVLARLYYDGPMAQGRVVASEPEASGFTRVVPGDPEEAMYHAACARPKESAEAQASAPPAAPPVVVAPVVIAPVVEPPPVVIAPVVVAPQ